MSKEDSRVCLKIAQSDLAGAFMLLGAAFNERFSVARTWQFWQGWKYLRLAGYWLARAVLESVIGDMDGRRYCTPLHFLFVPEYYWRKKAS